MKRKQSQAGSTVNPAATTSPADSSAAEPTASPATSPTEQALATEAALGDAMKGLLEADLSGSEPADDEESEAAQAQPAPPAEDDQTPVDEDEDSDEGPEDEPASMQGEPEFSESKRAEPTDQAPEEPEETEEDLREIARRKRWPKSYFKRLNKVTRDNAQLKGALQELIRTVEQLSQKVEPEREEPTQNLSSPVGLDEAILGPEARRVQQAIAQRRDWIEDLNRNLGQIERGEPPTDRQGKPVPWSREQIQTALPAFTEQIDDLKADLRDLRRERRKEGQALEHSLVQRHPWMADKTNHDYQVVRGVLERYPILDRIPEARTWLADGLAYQRLLEKALKAIGQDGGGAQARAAPARAPARPAAVPRRLPPRETEVLNRTKRFLETGNPEDGKALLEQLL